MENNDADNLSELENLLQTGIEPESESNLSCIANNYAYTSNSSYKVLGETIKHVDLMIYGGNFQEDIKNYNLLEQLGHTSAEQLSQDYMKGKLSQSDYQLYEFALQVQMMGGGIEQILKQVPQEQKAQLEEQYKYVQGEFFQKKIQKTQENLMNDKGGEIMQAMTYESMLSYVLMEDQRTCIERMKEENPDAKIVVLNPLLAEYSKKLNVETADKIINLNSQDGALTVTDDNGHKIYIGGTNYQGENNLDIYLTNGSPMKNNLEAKLSIVDNSNIQEPGIDEGNGIIGINPNYGVYIEKRDTEFKVGIPDYSAVMNPDYDIDRLKQRMKEIAEIYENKVIIADDYDEAKVV